VEGMILSWLGSGEGCVGSPGLSFRKIRPPFNGPEFLRNAIGVGHKVTLGFLSYYINGNLSQKATPFPP